MTNKKRKGFTIVELVIVIAVIAILAGVLIPTFASIIDKANQSSDIQAVRQMNVMLKAESVDKTLEFNDVIEIVSEAGYDTVEKRIPKSSGHGFYWHSVTNTIVLVKGTSELVYPKDNETINGIFIEGFNITINTYFKKLAVEVEPDEGGTEPEEIDNAEDLIANLINPNTSGTINLGSSITLSVNNLPKDEEGNYPEGLEIVNDTEGNPQKVVITISGGTSDEPLVINLNNQTLTLDASVSVVITGHVLFDGATESTLSELSGGANSEDGGNATRYSKRSTSANLMECDTEDFTSSIIIEADEAYYINDIIEGAYWDDNYSESVITNPGFKVETNGTLTISNLEIQGNRYCNIDNVGTVSLNNVKFEVTTAPIFDEGFDNATALSYGIINRGEVSFEKVKYNENKTLDEITYPYVNYAYGIHNEGTITSILNSSFTVNGGYGIKNYGPATINNTTFNVNGVCGFYNEHTSTSEDDEEDTVTITGGSFIAAGKSVCSVYNESGTMTISGSTFRELIKEGVEVSYSNYAPIKSTGGTVTFNSGSVTISNEAYSCINASSSTNLTINGGSFSGKIACDETSPVTINGGQFYIGTKADYVDFNELTAEEIHTHICFADYNVILKAVDNTDGSTTKTCTIAKSTSTNKYTFKAEDKKIADNEDISIYLSEEGVVLADEEMTISGDLSIKGKRLYVGETKTPKQIIVNPTGTLSLNVGQYYFYEEESGKLSDNGCGAMANRLQIIKDATGKFGTVNFRPNHNIYTDGDGNLVQVDKTDKVTILKEPVTLTE